MTRNWNPARRGGVLGALLLSLLLTLSACGGAASPTAAPTAASAASTATSVVAAATTPTVAATPATASATATSVASPTVAPAIATGVSATPIVPTATIAPTATVAPTPTVAPIPTVAPTVAAAPRAGQPVRIQIPSIKVDAAIEYVGLTPDGNMDTPKNYDNTAWYEPGARPGDVGNAAIAGHVDSKSGIAVFWYLSKLKPGDEVFVVGDDGVTRRFVVAAIDSYGRTDAPLQQIFGPTSERHLNIITCDSTTPFADGHYASNVVVYTNYTP